MELPELPRKLRADLNPLTPSVSGLLLMSSFIISAEKRADSLKGVRGGFRAASGFEGYRLSLDITLRIPVRNLGFRVAYFAR